MLCTYVHETTQGMNFRSKQLERNSHRRLFERQRLRQPGTRRISLQQGLRNDAYDRHYKSRALALHIKQALFCLKGASKSSQSWLCPACSESPRPRALRPYLKTGILCSLAGDSKLDMSSLQLVGHKFYEPIPASYIIINVSSTHYICIPGLALTATLTLGCPCCPTLPHRPSLRSAFRSAPAVRDMYMSCSAKNFAHRDTSISVQDY